MNDTVVICSRCIYDSQIPNISFDDNGICNYCRQIDELELQYLTGKPEGEKLLKKIIEDIKIAGKKRNMIASLE